MSDIRQSVKLYNLMANRLEKSGKAPCQASVYNEIAEYISDCSSLEEAALKIKNSKYFLAPSVALVKDKLTILRDIAKENRLQELVEVYDTKIAAIDNDVQEIYETGYERTAQNIKIKYQETIEAFCHLYEAYMMLSCDIAGDDEQRQAHSNEIEESLGRLSTPESDFLKLATLPKFRELIPATEYGYNQFVTAISEISNSDFSYDDELLEIDRETKSEWDELRQAKDLIKEGGREYLAKIKKSRVTVVSPDDDNGRYSFMDEVVDTYE